MIYSYGSRRFRLEENPRWDFWMSFFLFWISYYAVEGIAKLHFGRLFAAVTLLVFLVGLVIRLRKARQSSPGARRDVPSGLEVTAEGIRLYRDDNVYAEIPRQNLDYISQEQIDIFPDVKVWGVRLIIRPDVDGIDEVFVLPYLEGYTEFLESLRSIAPKFAVSELQSEYGEYKATHRPNSALAGYFIWGLYLIPLVAVVIASVLALFAPQVLARLVAYWPGAVLWNYAIGVFLALAAVMLAVSYIGPRGTAWKISFQPDRISVDRGFFRRIDLKPDDIKSIEVIAPNGRPERHIIRHTKGWFEIAADRHEYYAGVIERLKVRMGV